MKVIIGLQPQYNDKLEQLKAIANAAVRWAGTGIRVPLEFEFATVDQPCDGVATSWHKGTMGLVVFSERFFRLEPPAQYDVVVHELFHLELLDGPLGNRQYRRPSQPPKNGPETQRQGLAYSLWHLPEEALVEAMFASRFPGRSQCRADALADRWDPMPSVQLAIGPLKRFAMMWEFTRGELALNLGPSEVSKHRLLAALSDFAAAGAREEVSWPGLEFQRSELLRVRTDPVALNEAAASDLRDIVLRVEV